MATQGVTVPYCLSSIHPAPVILPSSQTPMRNCVPESCSEMQKAMENEAIKSLGSQARILPPVFQLVQVDNELQKDLGEKGEIQCFLTTQNQNSVDKASNLFPIVSKLYDAASLTSNRGSTIAAKAICDAFHLARKVAHSRFQTIHRGKFFMLPTAITITDFVSLVCSTKFKTTDPDCQKYLV